MHILTGERSDSFSVCSITSRVSVHGSAVRYWRSANIGDLPQDPLLVIAWERGLLIYTLQGVLLSGRWDIKYLLFAAPRVK